MFSDYTADADFAQERFDRAADQWHDDSADREGRNLFNAMGMMKNYLLKLQEGISEHQFGQDAVEWAVVTGLVKLTYNRQTDLATLVTNYDSIIDSYRKARQDSAPLLELTMQFARAAGLPITEIASGDIEEAA